MGGRAGRCLATAPQPQEARERAYPPGPSGALRGRGPHRSPPAGPAAAAAFAAAVSSSRPWPSAPGAQPLLGDVARPADREAARPTQAVAAQGPASPAHDALSEPGPQPVACLQLLPGTPGTRARARSNSGGGVRRRGARAWEKQRLGASGSGRGPQESAQGAEGGV